MWHRPGKFFRFELLQFPTGNLFTNIDWANCSSFMHCLHDSDTRRRCACLDAKCWSYLEVGLRRRVVVFSSQMSPYLTSSIVPQHQVAAPIKQGRPVVAWEHAQIFECMSALGKGWLGCLSTPSPTLLSFTFFALTRSWMERFRR